MRRIASLVICAVALAFVMPAAADAAKKKKKKSKKAKEEPPPKAPEQMEWLEQGHAAYLIRDFDKSLELYKKAGEKMPKSPAAHYFIGVALKAKGDNKEALESFRTAYLMATGSEEMWKSIALIQVALVAEAMGDLDEAKKAWKDYTEYVDSKAVKPDLGPLAEKRNEAIDKVAELKEKYDPVAKLIVEQKDKEKEAAANP